MVEITAGLVKELREKTGVGMMDCKKALAETAGDLEAAVDWLRAKGLSKAAKKADRAAAEGLVGVAVDGPKGAIIELNSETDFVARNEQFQKTAASYAQLALKIGGDVEKLLAAPAPGGSGTVKDEITALIATIGENINLRRAGALSVGQGVVAAYTHNPSAPNLGRVGVLVALESAGKAEVLSDIGRKIAMHVAATAPLAVAVEEIPADAIAREKAILTEQAKDSGKPANVIEKMIEGRLRKFYEEVVLTKQAFVMNPDQTVEQALKEAEKAAGAPITLKAFLHFRLGDGVEKKTDDFAAEVAATAAGGR
jgi:elongation factor Ts